MKTKHELAKAVARMKAVREAAAKAARDAREQSERVREREQQ